MPMLLKWRILQRFPIYRFGQFRFGTFPTEQMVTQFAGAPDRNSPRSTYKDPGWPILIGHSFFCQLSNTSLASTRISDRSLFAIAPKGPPTSWLPQYNHVFSWPETRRPALRPGARLAWRRLQSCRTTHFWLRRGYRGRKETGQEDRHASDPDLVGHVCLQLPRQNKHWRKCRVPFPNASSHTQAHKTPVNKWTYEIDSFADMKK